MNGKDSLDNANWKVFDELGVKHIGKKTIFICRLSNEFALKLDKILKLEVLFPVEKIINPWILKEVNPMERLSRFYSS
jgi:hypothetical protein